MVGLAAGLAVAADAGGLRTDSAYDRFLEAHRAFHVALLDDGQTPPPPALEAVARLPEVAVAARGRLFYELGDNVAFAPRDGRIGTVINRFTVLEGRLPRPDRVDEVMIGFALAERLRLGVGSTFPLIEPEYRKEAARLGIRDRTMRVVGVEAGPHEFPPQFLGATPLMHHTPAFYRAYSQTGVLPPGDSLLVRLRNGRDDVASFVSGVRKLSAGKPVFYTTEPELSEPIQRSFHLQATALWITAALLGLTLTLVFGQTLTRLTLIEATETPLLRALGMSRVQIWLVGLGRAAVVAGCSGLMAVVSAVALSPLTPLGLARKAEPNPGVAVDPSALAAGGVATFVIVMFLIAVPAWRAAGPPSAARCRAAPGPRRRPPLHARFTGAYGLPPAALVGVRMAVTPGRGRGAIPVRSTVAGSAIAVAALTGALGFGANLHHLVSTPRLFGWNWDVAVTNYASGPDLRTRVGGLDHDERITGFSVGDAPIPLLAGDRQFWALAVDGTVIPPLLAGRAPAGPGEIALATKTARDLGVEIGDSIDVAISGTRPRQFRVVGRTVLSPPVESRLGEGALLTFAALERLLPDLSAGYVLLRIAPNTDREALLDDLRRRFGDPFVVVPRESPDDIVNFGRIRLLPALLAGVLGALAAATLAHTLLTSARRRRRDVAILKTLGFERRQVGATFTSQATVLVIVAVAVGVPVGMAASNWAWVLFADRSGVARETVLPAGHLGLVLAGALLLGPVLALVPAWLASRTDPAGALRAE
jgi:ABC-type lipoprotein release transport system permease subunit